MDNRVTNWPEFSDFMFPALYLRVIEGDEQKYFRSVLATNVVAEFPNPYVESNPN